MDGKNCDRRGYKNLNDISNFSFNRARSLETYS